MRRVVITGIGIISSIGNYATEVAASLRAGKSGIVFAPTYAEHGFRSQIHGMPQIVLEDHIDKRNLRFMGRGRPITFWRWNRRLPIPGWKTTMCRTSAPGW